MMPYHNIFDTVLLHYSTILWHFMCIHSVYAVYMLLDICIYRHSYVYIHIYVCMYIYIYISNHEFMLFCTGCI